MKCVTGEPHLDLARYKVRGASTVCILDNGKDVLGFEKTINAFYEYPHPLSSSL